MKILEAKLKVFMIDVLYSFLFGYKPTKRLVKIFRAKNKRKASYLYSNRGSKILRLGQKKNYTK